MLVVAQIQVFGIVIEVQHWSLVQVKVIGIKEVAELKNPDIYITHDARKSGAGTKITNQVPIFSIMNKCINELNQSNLSHWIPRILNLKL